MEPSFSIRSAKAFVDSSQGSKPKSSSCDSVLLCGAIVEEVKPNAACQSVVDATGIVSGISAVGIDSENINKTLFIDMAGSLQKLRGYCRHNLQN